jgi:hypothetical protein
MLSFPGHKFSVHLSDVFLSFSVHGCKNKIAGTEHLQMFSTHDARCVAALLHCSLVNFSCSGVAVPRMLMSPRARGTWGQDSWRPLHISSLQNSKVLLLQKPQHENWLSFHFCLDSFRKSAALLCSEKFCSILFLNFFPHFNELLIWGNGLLCLVRTNLKFECKYIVSGL